MPVKYSVPKRQLQTRPYLLPAPKPSYETRMVSVPLTAEQQQTADQINSLLQSLSTASNADAPGITSQINQLTSDLESQGITFSTAVSTYVNKTELGRKIYTRYQSLVDQYNAATTDAERSKIKNQMRILETVLKVFGFKTEPSKQTTTRTTIIDRLRNVTTSWKNLSQEDKNLLNSLGLRGAYNISILTGNPEIFNKAYQSAIDRTNQQIQTVIVAPSPTSTSASYLQSLGDIITSSNQVLRRGTEPWKQQAERMGYYTMELWNPTTKAWEWVAIDKTGAAYLQSYREATNFVDALSKIGSGPIETLQGLYQGGLQVVSSIIQDPTFSGVKALYTKFTSPDTTSAQRTAMREQLIVDMTEGYFYKKTTSAGLQIIQAPGVQYALFSGAGTLMAPAKAAGGLAGGITSTLSRTGGILLGLSVPKAMLPYAATQFYQGGQGKELFAMGVSTLPMAAGYLRGRLTQTKLGTYVKQPPYKPTLLQRTYTRFGEVFSFPKYKYGEISKPKLKYEGMPLESERPYNPVKSPITYKENIPTLEGQPLQTTTINIGTATKGIKQPTLRGRLEMMFPERTGKLYDVLGKTTDILRTGYRRLKGFEVPVKSGKLVGGTTQGYTWDFLPKSKGYKLIEKKIYKPSTREWISYEQYKLGKALEKGQGLVRTQQIYEPYMEGGKRITKLGIEQVPKEIMIPKKGIVIPEKPIPIEGLTKTNILDILKSSMFDYKLGTGKFKLEPRTVEYIGEAGSRRQQLRIKGISLSKWTMFKDFWTPRLKQLPRTVKIRTYESEIRKGPVTSAFGGLATETIQTPETNTRQRPSLDTLSRGRKLEPFFETYRPDLIDFLPKGISYQQKQFTGEISEQGFNVKPFQGELIKPKLGEISEPKFDVISLTEPKFAQITEPIFKTTQELIQRTIPLQLKEQTFKQPPVFPIPPITTEESISKISKPKPGYNIYAKERKKWIKVNPFPVTKTQAYGIGSKVTDETTSRSFKVKATNANARTLPQYDNTWSQLQFKFRPKKDTFIEKTSFAIDTLGEHQGITVQGWKAQNMKKQGQRYTPTALYSPTFWKG